MLYIKTLQTSIRIEVFNFASVDDIQAEVEIDYDFFSCTGNLKAESIWLYMSGWRKFFEDLRGMIEGEGMSACIKDMSSIFSLTLTKVDLGALLTVVYKQNKPNCVFNLDLPVEFDIINVVYRQMSEFFYQHRASD